MVEETRQTCDELVAAVRGMTPRERDRYLARLKWLDEIADTQAAAAFTGLSVQSVRDYHRQANRRRVTGDTEGWMWPAPDMVVGGRPAWKLRSLVTGRAAMPGRGRGGGSTRRHFDQAFRDKAVASVLAGGKTIRQTALELGVHNSTLGAWVAAARED